MDRAEHLTGAHTTGALARPVAPRLRRPGWRDPRLLAGLVEAARLGASDAAKIGLNAELDAIAAVVVGGTALTGGRATILGTVVGALIMQVIATSFNMLLVPYAWSLALKAAIILFAVYLQRPKRV